MKANELRIGNVIRYTNEKDLNRALRGTVLCVDIDTLMYVENNSRANFYEPITLTPEILEKCGFETPKMYQDTVKFKDGVMIDLHRGKILLRDNGRIELLHLHQLQNLYFALTGEELEVKL